VETPEGSVRIPSGHVRFSIWIEDEAVAAVSVADHQAEELAAYLQAVVGDPREPDEGGSIPSTRVEPRAEEEVP
jgi:hypothetical protein